MTKQQYEAVFRWFNARPAARRALHAAATAAVAAVYGLYIGLLVWLAVTRQPLFFAMAGVPAAVFLLGTVLRRAINRPRPYETLGFAPLFPKHTRGQSFPSRHCFSAAGIAVSAWYFHPALAAVLAGLALLIAVTRVLTGAHYPTDVLAGLAFGGVAAWLGFALVSLWL